MHLYKDCSDLSIKKFDIIYKTNDFRYLIVGWDGYEEIEVPKGANERWQDIRNEWIDLLDNNVIAYYYQLVLESVYLQTRYNVVKQLLNMIWMRDEFDEEAEKIYVGALAEWKYKWNPKQNKTKEMERLLKQLKRSENKIELKLDELEKLKKENDITDDVSSLEKQAVALEQITGKNNIDTETTSVMKWVEITKLSESINEQRRKANGK
tara:strand:- start:8808 stop:9434 length:627 start_codon:yes stop_codon:yes gene_type:complete